MEAYCELAVPLGALWSFSVGSCRGFLQRLSAEATEQLPRSHCCLHIPCRVSYRG